ncbi:MAG: glycosyltransferase family 2 protein, partial [Lachnospiraceae bacterium]|nr:glycosyltransferase family 2 protein [Lachnospiraceae bacterium]
IGSVEWQTYSNWELCLADGSDDAHSYVKDVVSSYNDSRIKYKKLEKNGGISENTNQCLTLATGEYIGLFDHDDILHPSALFEYVKVINEQDADYIYCDETTFKSGNINHMLTMHFKPDYAIDNLRANNYICHFSVFKRKLLDSTELFRTKFDGSQDHDMILRLTDKAERIVHVPKLLYYWRCHPASVASNISAKTYAIDAAKGAVADHLRKHGYTDFRITGTKAFETIFKIRYKINGTPLITVVIPNKDHASDLKRCVTSILEKSTYTNFEIIIVENNSEEKKTFDLYEELKETSEKVNVVEFKGEFNYSEVNNFGVSFAKGEYILLLNNDTEVISVNWLEEMLMYAQREDVGAVGAKLYYADKTIQHAGVVIGLGAHRTAGHTHYKMPKDNLGYMGRLCYAQDVSAVTGACLLVKKSLWDKVGGLDTDFKISLNDVDFCLKLRKEGYLNVFTPFAELYHYESISRGLDDKGEKAQRYNEESERFRNKWKTELEKGDPYYNPNFSLDRSDFSVRI